MLKTYLQLVNDCERELGLPVSSTVEGDASSATGRQLGALANRVIDELRRRNRWTALQIEYNLEVAPPFTRTGNLTAHTAIITNMFPSTAGIQPDIFMVRADNVPTAARVLSVDSLTQVTISMTNNNIADAMGVTFTFMRDTYPMPPGFDWFINRTMWDRTNQWELIGPDSPQQDQWQRSGIVPVTPRRHFRKVGPFSNAFRLWPPPAELTSPLRLSFEYQTTHTVMVHGDSCTLAIEFVHDDDVCVLDDQAILTGMKWMFWEIKGFGSYVTMQNRWVDYVDRLVARDGAAPTLSMVHQSQTMFISPANVQDGNYPEE